jgi:hypothetical protein
VCFVFALLPIGRSDARKMRAPIGRRAAFEAAAAFVAAAGGAVQRPRTHN